MIVERIEEVFGIYTRSVLLDEGDWIPQHVHDHDHATLVGNGKARLWADGVFVADHEAGSLIPIKAGVQHEFRALEPNTRLVCIHDVDSAESAKEK